MPFLRGLFTQKEGGEAGGTGEEASTGPKEDSAAGARGSVISSVGNYVDPNMPKEDYRLIGEKLTFQFFDAGQTVFHHGDFGS